MRLVCSSAASIAFLCLSAPAQQRLDPARLFPITTPVRNAGTVDVTTGRWRRRGEQLKLGSQVIYNNTCTWVGGGYYGAFDWCEENYDEGRIPSPSDPFAPCGSEPNNTILSIQVSYCTYAGPLAGVGGYDMDLAFFNKLNGDCVGLIPPTPPPVSITSTAYLPLGGLGLPGSTALGFLACWKVTLDVSNTGMVLASDGEGTFNGVGADDKFIWMQRQNTTVGALSGPTPDGFIVSGEPATGGFGACSYSIPCGIDAGFGNTCGTGLDTFDGSWINVDGVAPGGSTPPAGCHQFGSAYGFGTNCYFFGGYPSFPFASYWLVLTSDGRGVCSAIPFCTQTKVTTVANCSAILSCNDLTLATGSWNTTNIPRSINLAPGVTVGIYIYTHGVGIGQSATSLATPFGTLCLTNATRSTAHCAAVTAPTLPGICNQSVLSLAVNCDNIGQGPLGVVVGEDANVQGWYRDAGAVADANFSNAIWYTVQ